MDYQHSDETYKEATDWLYSQLPMFSKIGAPAYREGLETTEKLDKLFGHPHKKFKTIHIGGTNGKGSTSHMLASVLQAQGYKTALYTSPHLVDFRERMKINGKMIPRENVVRFVRDWRNADSGLKPSFFELTMMMAFDWFAKEKVDYAIIEVGMGGRLDSTNVISPLLSVITNISFDHTQFLGDSLLKIASEKAGIIKSGVPVVIGEADGDIRALFTERAGDVNAPIVFAEDRSPVAEWVQTQDQWEAVLKDGRKVVVPLPGNYQKKNIHTVLVAVEALKRRGIEISSDALRKGLQKVTESTGLRGRWQKLQSNPVVICDTGHNRAGIEETMATLSRLYPAHNKRFVLGFVNDKDVDHIIDLFPREATYYITQASVPRAMPASELASKFRSRNFEVKLYDSVKSAYESALTDAAPSDILYVGGSTFIVADLLASMHNP